MGGADPMADVAIWICCNLGEFPSRLYRILPINRVGKSGVLLCWVSIDFLQGLVVVVKGQDPKGSSCVKLFQVLNLLENSLTGPGAWPCAGGVA